MTAESHPLVLLIGDDPVFLELAELAISKCGYTVPTAQSGLDGLQLFQERMTDLVVLDLIMPGMDGIDTLRLIREFSNCPINNPDAVVHAHTLHLRSGRPPESMNNLVRNAEAATSASDHLKYARGSKRAVLTPPHWAIGDAPFPEISLQRLQ